MPDSKVSSRKAKLGILGGKPPGISFRFCMQKPLSLVEIISEDEISLALILLPQNRAPSPAGTRGNRGLLASY